MENCGEDLTRVRWCFYGAGSSRVLGRPVIKADVQKQEVNIVRIFRYLARKPEIDRDAGSSGEKEKTKNVRHKECGVVSLVHQDGEGGF